MKLLWALVLGGGLGLVYGFLQPLRRRLGCLADGIFILALWYVWLQLSFGICGGQLRLTFTLAMLLGAAGWVLTLGKWLQPVFDGFWRGVGRIFRIFTLPVKNFLENFLKLCKKVFANLKKWVTIKRTIRIGGNTTGGVHYGAPQKEKISHRAAQKPPGDLGLHPADRGPVHRGADHPAGKYRGKRGTV